jgi:hypothetical protein
VEQAGLLHKTSLCCKSIRVPCGLDEIVRGIRDHIGKQSVEEEMGAAVVDEFAAESDSVYDRCIRIDVLEPETQEGNAMSESIYANKNPMR